LTFILFFSFSLRLCAPLRLCVRELVLEFQMDSSLRNSLIKAATEFGTPIYVYDKATIATRCKSLADCITYPRNRLLYAMKANSNHAVLKTIIDAGFSVDCVSLGEALFAKKLGAKDIL